MAERVEKQFVCVYSYVACDDVADLQDFPRKQNGAQLSLAGENVLDRFFVDSRVEDDKVSFAYRDRIA